MNENWHIVGCIPANIAIKLGMLGRTPIKKAHQSAGLIIVVPGRKQYTRHFFFLTGGDVLPASVVRPIAQNGVLHSILNDNRFWSGAVLASCRWTQSALPQS